ncbi:putative restnol dehydrogenase, partial [Operophtera brumata]
MVSSHVIYVAVPISVIVALGLLRKWRSRSWAKCVTNTCLRGKTFLITGANSGIGLETARALVKRKARISIELDLASFESIEKFVEVVKAGFHKIDVLINNAGVVVPLKEDQKTNEGFEIHLGVNHLGHFYLTQLLMDLLKRATPSRIVIVSSTLHERGKINFEDLNLRAEIEVAKSGKAGRHNPGYCNSKLMNVYFMRALADQLRGSGIDVNACCPGFCYTNLF